ncbi:GTPase HflX [Methylolobus aquaticus]|nr:GTPase HflX [Methylolobus aquaticus]
MFDRPSAGERAVLVHVQLAPVPSDVDELKELAVSAGADPVAVVRTRRHSPDPRYCIGSGKLTELAEVVRAHEAELVLFDNSLTPSQERNLEKALNVRVIDRTALILDIFAQRAQSFEGKLQVELAQLRHLSTRLVRGWTHLERQKGGIGLRGPGETQLETDKRLIANRIRQIRKKLDKVEQQRDQGRQARRRNAVPIVGLVGYTNAGKSSLFNALTQSEVYAADQLFATLDPTLRRRPIGPNLAVILADTVGFIRDLPHELIAAFRSTLHEASRADLLLHVIDVSDEHAAEKYTEVEAVLAEIGAESVPRIEVYNKIDLIEGESSRYERDPEGRMARVWLSARSRDGLEWLDQAFEEQFTADLTVLQLRLAPAESALRAKLYQLGRVLEERDDDGGGWHLVVELPTLELRRLESSGFVMPRTDVAEAAA